MMVVFSENKEIICSYCSKYVVEKLTQVYDYKSFINYMVVEDPILRGYYNGYKLFKFKY